MNLLRVWLAAALWCAAPLAVAQVGTDAPDPEVEPTAASEPETKGASEPHANPEREPGATNNDSLMLVVDAEIIDDPEIDDPVSHGSNGPAMDTSFVPTGDVRMVLQSRVGVDLVWKNPREDVVEATQIALFETRLRRSENLRFQVGVRARHQIASRERATPEQDAVRHSVDLVPTAAYVDATVTDGVHVRAGYQVTRMGRFDLFSATNFLAVADLRSGPVTMPDAVDVAQPAVRLDWDASPWLHVQVIHVPFFQPHLVDTFDGDYGLFRATQADVDAALDAIAAGVDDTIDPTSTPDCSDPLESRCRIRAFMRQVSRSGSANAGAAGLGAWGPSPSLANPQGAVRVTARSGVGELSLTVGTALERLPSLFVDKSLQDVLRDPNMSETDRLQRLSQIERPFDTLHNRFYVVSMDGAMPVGPLQVGFEAAYMAGRTLYSAQTECSGPPGQDCVFYAPEPEQTDMVHGAIRVELAQDESLVIGLEAFGAYTLSAPRRHTDHAWLTLAGGRAMYGAAVLSRWVPADGDFTFELATVALNGPSFVLSPRVQWRAHETLYAELGATWIEGADLPPRVPNPAMRGTTTSADWAVGGMYSNVDQVFVGLKWVP